MTGVSAGEKASSSIRRFLEWITKDLDDVLSLSVEFRFMNPLYFGRVLGSSA